MQQNIELIISVASSRLATKWLKQKITWFDFVEKLRVPIKSTETLDQYMKLPKKDQDNLKDVGGYIGGELVNGSRKQGVLYRSFIALDLDNIPPGETENVLRRLSSLNCTHVTHSTRKHSLYNPRVRVIIPTTRIMTPDEYEPVSRKTASYIGMEYCDPTTFQVGRLMYWPSCSSDSQYIHQYISGDLLDVDGILKLYKDWQDIKEWPQVPGEEKDLERKRKKKEDPLNKKGIIGAFCRSYTIREAMDKFLPGIYEECGRDDKLTYTGGSTTAGATIYDDVFLYSYHATDPCSLELCNAFDMVRLHKFGDLDHDVKDGTLPHNLPSYKETIKLALRDEIISSTFDMERLANVKSEFYKTDHLIDAEWVKLLKRNETTLRYENTRENILIILENDPGLKEKMVYEEFSNSLLVGGTLPWDESGIERNWTDVDDAELRIYFESTYGITGNMKIEDGLKSCFKKNQKNKLQDYLNSLVWDGVERLDTSAIDYLGAEDNAFTREATSKSMIAGVARAFGNYVKWDNMPVFTGKQGIGKSTYIRYFGKDWFSDSLQSFEGKEAYESLQGVWVLEIGELNALNRSELNAAKLFLSKVEDIYRVAYGKRTEKFPRKCVFFGTTNEDDFLRDNTGNRRFWVLPVGITKPTKNIWLDLPNEVDQHWAEAVVRYRRGESLLLSPEADKLSKQAQRDHRVISDKEGVILEFLEKEIPENWYTLDVGWRKGIMQGTRVSAVGVPMVKRDKVCPLEIYVECFNGSLNYTDDRPVKEIRRILRGLEGWEESKSPIKFGEGYGLQRGFRKILKGNI